MDARMSPSKSRFYRTKDIQRTPSGVYALVVRGGVESLAKLSEVSPRWNFLFSGSFVEIDEDEWRALLA